MSNTENERTERVEVRLTAKEKEAWETEAGINYIDLSVWVRMVCNQRAGLPAKKRKEVANAK